MDRIVNVEFNVPEGKTYSREEFAEKGWEDMGISDIYAFIRSFRVRPDVCDYVAGNRVILRLIVFEDEQIVHVHETLVKD